MPLPPLQPAPSDDDAATSLSELGRRLIRHSTLRRLCLPWSISLERRFQPVLWGQPLTSAEIGRLGEHLAARWLRRQGRRILHRNYRGPQRGEVDIVARHGKVLTFVEVKTRTSSAYGRPADAVTPDKQRLIQRGAQDWLRLLGQPRVPMRFDIVEVLLIPGELPEPNLIENAFGFPDSSIAGR